MLHWDNLEGANSRRTSVAFHEADWRAALTQPLLIRVGSTKDDKGRSEQTIQREIIKALRAVGVRVKHTPNAVPFGGDKGAKIKQAARWRADGVCAGWPDLDVYKPGAAVRYGHLEVKRPGCYLDPEQVKCIAHMRADGALVAGVSSADDALAAVSRWGWL